MQLMLRTTEPSGTSEETETFSEFLPLVSISNIYPVLVSPLVIKFLEEFLIEQIYQMLC